jgi:GAF domain-containing protein
MISNERLANAFVEVADTLIDEFDVIDFLHILADHASDVTGASSVGLMLVDLNDSLQHMAASTDGARHLELFQLQHQEGPCLDCFRTGTPVIVRDLTETTTRWPVFAPRAIEAGVLSVHAFPMRLRDQVIGALNLFGEVPLPFDPDDIRVVQAMADIATIGILQERAISSAEILTAQLQGALNSRILIEQAKGVMARAHGIDVDEGFVALRAHARNNHLRLGDLAHDVVNGTIELPQP